MTQSHVRKVLSSRVARLARGVWPTVPEPIDATSYRRAFGMWWVFVVLGGLNVATGVAMRGAPGHDPSVYRDFLAFNLPCHAVAIGISAVARRRGWGEQAHRRFTYALLAAEYLAGLSGIWLANGSIGQAWLNWLLFSVLVAFARAFYDARIGLFAFGLASGLPALLVALQALGWVSAPTWVEKGMLDPAFTGSSGRIVALLWGETVNLVIWTTTSYAVKRLRETDWALATERAALRDLEARMARAHEGGARSGTTLARGYVLGELLGRGAMGEVYEARHLDGDALFAVKVLHGHLVQSSVMMERFQRESEIMARLPEKFVAPLIDRGRTDDGAPFFVMERLRGEDLATRLRRVGRLSVQDALPYLRALAAALDAAHANGIVHRDLKPQNVFLCEEGIAGASSLRLLDFGISRLLEADGGGLTRSAWVLGSPGYLAPEQARGENDRIGPAADVFALGAIAYRMLTGVSAFRAREIASAIFEAVHVEPIPPGDLVDGLPRAVDAVMALALAKSIETRYARAGEFVRDLELACAGTLSQEVIERGRRVRPLQTETASTAASAVG